MVFVGVYSGLNPCWLKANLFVICYVLSVVGWQRKIKMNHRCWLDSFTFFFFFPFFFVFTFEFSSVYSQWCSKQPVRDHFTFSSSLLSNTVVRLHKGKIESLRQNRSPLQTALSSASYILIVCGKKYKTDEEPVAQVVHLKSIIDSYHFQMFISFVEELGLNY